MSSPEQTTGQKRKAKIRDHADRFAPNRRNWVKRTRYFHDADLQYLRFLVEPGKKILDIGCGVGDLLAGLEPSNGVGLDLSPKMIAMARETHPELTFGEGDIESADSIKALEQHRPFDFIILSDTIGVLGDCQSTLESLEKLCGRDTRIIIAYYNYTWSPVLNTLEAVGLKMPQVEKNYLSSADITHILNLAGFDVVKQEWRVLMPMRLFGLGTLINRFIATMPFIRRLGLRNYTIARPLNLAAMEPKSVSVVIPARNEMGNVEAAIKRLPDFGSHQEVIFIEGHSQDGTFEEIERVAQEYGEQIKIKYARQDGKGKGDAMRKGYELAENDIIMILDGDLTMPPEDLPKFYNAMVQGRGEFINGSRLVYPMEDEAMRFLNLIANSVFAWIFSWLLNQRITDTLCGTKVFTREHYRRIEAGRSYFGEFDPFGDFDLIFGASKQNLKIIDMPIRYANRAYGETQISRFSHGVLLLRMVVFAFRKLKAF
jgi:SAM-dependent methyltransferase